MAGEFVWTLFLLGLITPLVFSCLMSTPAEAAPPKNVNQLIVERLADLPDRELDMLTVEYPPGGRSPPHRHDAYVLVYVLQGVVEMQIAGHEVVTLKAGETFIERPADIHIVSRNASQTEPAKLLVVALKADGRPLTRAVATLPSGKKIFVERCSSCRDEDGSKGLPDGTSLVERLAGKEDVRDALAGRLRKLPEQEQRAVLLYVNGLVDGFRSAHGTQKDPGK